MNCSQVHERLPEFVYGDLPEGEALQVDEHLKECASCQKERAALRHIRHVLGSATEPALPIDLAGIYGQVAALQRRRARVWRRAALSFLGTAAAVLVISLALQLEVRVDAHQVVIGWRTTLGPPAPRIPPALEIQVASGTQSTKEIQDELGMLNALMQALAQQESDRDRQRAQDRAWFQAKLDELREQTILHWTATERDVAALCSTQLTQTQKGVSP